MITHQNIERDVRANAPMSSTRVVTYDSSELEKRRKNDWSESKKVIEKVYGKGTIV